MGGPHLQPRLGLHVIAHNAADIELLAPAITQMQQIIRANYHRAPVAVISDRARLAPPVPGHASRASSSSHPTGRTSRPSRAPVAGRSRHGGSADTGWSSRKSIALPMPDASPELALYAGKLLALTG